MQPELLEDAVLLAIKEEIKLAIEETLEEEIIERVLVNDRVDIPIREFKYRLPYDLTEPDPLYTSTPAARIEIEEVEKD